MVPPDEVSVRSSRTSLYVPLVCAEDETVRTRVERLVYETCVRSASSSHVEVWAVFVRAIVNPAPERSINFSARFSTNEFILVNVANLVFDYSYLLLYLIPCGLILVGVSTDRRE